MLGEEIQPLELEEPLKEDDILEVLRGTWIRRSPMVSYKFQTQGHKSFKSPEMLHKKSKLMGKPKGIRKNKSLSLYYTNRKQPPNRLHPSSNSSRKGHEMLKGVMHNLWLL